MNKFNYGLGLLCLSIILMHTSCARKVYRERADEESYEVIHKGSKGTPWEVEQGFSVDPSNKSRLYDPSDPDYPVLPDPRPNLYDFKLEIPELIGQKIMRKLSTDDSEGGTGKIQPIPKNYWEVLPVPCLERMFEFDSVLTEYHREYSDFPEGLENDETPRLSLAQVLEQAKLHSRSYQAQKEALYRSALSLTLERFDYGLKFSPGGVGSDATYTMDESDGVRSESGSISSDVQMDRMLATGGTFLARFANDVVFTFDGPEGWTKDLSSELFFEINQSLFQRDIQFDSLIQAERNLIYAARDYARFRRQFFLDIASRFYGILRNYRNIEIESQNYFSLVRTFEQAQAELRSGVTNSPNPVSVDQFEQGMLSGRSSLISSWNRLEQSLDSLKIEMGLPTEIPINVSLRELTELTDLDAGEVDVERVRRWLGRLNYLKTQPRLNRAEIYNANKYLVSRLIEWLEGTGKSGPGLEELKKLFKRILLEESKIKVSVEQASWSLAHEGQARPTIVFTLGRLQELIGVSIELLDREIDFGISSGNTEQDWEALKTQSEGFKKRLTEFRTQLPDAIQDTEGTGAELRGRGVQLKDEITALTNSLLTQLGVESAATAQEEDQKAIEMADQGIKLAKDLLGGTELGLYPITIEADQAMETALVQRFDLMNERGQLADDLRRVKLEADDLRSVLNFRANHRISSREDKPLKFSSKDSRTTFSLGIDLPFNRISQRNSYRAALLSYHAGRRSLMQLEDNIKFNIRDALRGLEETRTQYAINVRRAALAAEQVLSIRLQLALGIPGVRGTDLLDALQDSREALISVANARIGYIIDRADLAHELEQLNLDEKGFWPHIVDSSFQFTPDSRHPENAGPVYGRIPDHIWVSSELREQLTPVSTQEEQVIQNQSETVANEESKN